MNRRIMAALGVTVVLLTAGCDSDGGSDDEATAVCVDKAGNRVDDSQCHQDYDHNGGGMSAFEWYFIMSTLNQPAYGAQVVHNTYYSSTTTNRYAGFSRPQSAPIAKGVPKTGWTPSAGTKSFVPKDKSNIVAPKVMKQAQAPMYQNKPGSVNKAPAYKAPSPIRVGKR